MHSDCMQLGCTVIDVTEKAIEETARIILEAMYYAKFSMSALQPHSRFFFCYFISGRLAVASEPLKLIGFSISA